jgi:hypothetical protein
MPNNEIERVQESSLDVLPPAQAPSVSAQKMLVAHAEMMDTAFKLASAMVNTRMVPARFFQKADDATAAILYGAELGLNPIQSLQRVIPIHGMPSLEARTMVALLKSRGYKIRTLEQSDTSVTVAGVDLDGEEYQSTWTIDRATQAGYVPTIDDRTGKYRTNAKGNLIGNEKYLTDPQTMLKAKAQAEVCRDMAPDILMGITYTREELESENFDGNVIQPETKAAAQQPVTVDEILGTTADPGRGGGNDQSQGAKPSSGATYDTDSGDQEQAAGAAPEAEVQTSETEPEPVEEPAQPQPEPEPEPVLVDFPDQPEAQAAPAPEKSKMRQALERRLFKLLAIADINRENRADRLIIYRYIIDRQDINSTDDLTDVEVGAICDQLFNWDKAKELGDKVTDILNTATLAEVEAEEQQQSNTNTEGE